MKTGRRAKQNKPVDRKLKHKNKLRHLKIKVVPPNFVNLDWFNNFALAVDPLIEVFQDDPEQ